MGLDEIVAYTFIGLFTGAAYSIAASGLVLTYTTTRVFNIAHGAFGMLFAYLYWEFSVNQGLPVWLSLALILLVFAPATGWAIQRFVARGLGNGPVSVSLVVTVGLLVICFGVAIKAWPNNVARPPVPYFFGSHHISLGSTQVPYYQLMTILISIVVAGGLYLLLNKTRIGTAMRASVDNPDLLRLFGGKPDQAASLSWAIGISLAALTGILLVSTIGLNYYQLTLLVINAYAAAMLGRLKSLPLTFVGAMVLGLVTSFAVGSTFLDTVAGGHLSGIRPVIPSIFLFVLIIVLPQAQLRIGQVKGIVSSPLPSPVQAIGWAVALLVATIILTGVLNDVDLLKFGNALYIGIVMLSLVLLTGYGGHVSLGQLAFAGIGALSYAKFGEFNLTGLVFASLVAAAVGAVVALSVLRLTGLYLTLATLAFATLAEQLIFTSDLGFGTGGTKTVKPLHLFGITFGQAIGTSKALILLMAVVFIAMSLILLMIRRGVVGRMLIALRDSPAACGTLGLDQRWFRVVLFAFSAGIAGLAGALFSGLRGSVGAADFMAFSSLPLLLFAVVFGVTSMSGAALGGTAYMLYQFASPDTQGVILVILGVGALTLGRNPNGIANLIFRGGRIVEKQLGPRVREALPSLPGLSRPVAVAGAPAPVMAGAPTGHVHDHSGHDHDHGHGHELTPVGDPVGSGPYAGSASAAGPSSSTEGASSNATP